MIFFFSLSLCVCVGVCAFACDCVTVSPSKILHPSLEKWSLTVIKSFSWHYCSMLDGKLEDDKKQKRNLTVHLFSLQLAAI